MTPQPCQDEIVTVGEEAIIPAEDTGMVVNAGGILPGLEEVTLGDGMVGSNGSNILNKDRHSF